MPIRNREDDLQNPHRIFFRMLREYSEGRFDQQQSYYRARVEAVDPIGGQLESNPSNPPGSVRGRIYSLGFDATTPSEALTIFYPIGNVTCPLPGEHVLVFFEDVQRTSGYWISKVQSFHDQNYANPDFREPRRESDVSTTFEGTRSSPRQEVEPVLEYGGASLRTEGNQQLVERMERTEEADPWSGKRVLLIGDSQVAGPFGARLGEKLRADSSVSFFAREGRVSWGVDSWLRGALRADSPPLSSIEDVIRSNTPDVVVISLGGNDGSSGAANRSDYEDKVRQFLNRVSSLVSKIIWSGPPTAVGRGSTRQNGREVAARKIESVVGVNRFVNVFAVTNTGDGRAPDGVHFTNNSPALDPWSELVIDRGRRVLT